MKRILLISSILFLNHVSNGQNVAYIDSVKKLIPYQKNDSLLIILYLSISNEYWSDDPVNCERYAQKAFEIAKKTKRYNLMSSAYNNISSAYNFRGEIDSAIEYDKKNLALIHLYTDTMKILQAYNNYAEDLYRKSKFPESKNYIDSSFKLAKYYSKKDMLPNLYLNAGNLFYSAGKYQDAMDYYLPGMTVAVKLEDTSTLIKLYNNYSSLKIITGKVNDSVISLLNKAIAFVAVKTYYSQAGNVYNTMGAALVFQKNSAEAILFFKLSLGVAKELSNKIEIVNDYVNIAEQYNLLQRTDTALLYADSAITLADKIAYPKGLASAKSIKGFYYTKKGRFKEAHALLLAAYKELKAADDNSALNYSTLYLGNYYLQTNHTDSAIYYLSESLNYSMITSNDEYRSEAYNYLSTAFNQKGDFRNAYKYLNLHAQLTDSIENQKHFRTINELTTKFKVRERDQRIRNDEEQLKLKEREKKQLWLGIGLLAILLGIILRLLTRSKKQNTALVHEKKAVENLTGLIKHETSKQFGNLKSSISRTLRVAQPTLQVAKAIVEVQTYEMLYTKLFLSADFATISLKDAFEELFNYNCRAYGVQRIPDFRISGHCHIVYKATHYLFHYMNELISNSLLHAFDVVEAPTIGIDIRYEHMRYEITYSDNGCGIPLAKQQIIPNKGYYYIHAYATESLKGTLETNFSHGSTFKLKFK